MERCFLVLPMLFWIQVSSQIVVEKNTFNFGAINQGDQRYHDFNVVNQGSKREYILRAGQTEQTTVKFSSKTLEPGGTAFIRVQVNPAQKGAFSYKVPVFVSSSNKPLNLKLSGTANFIDQTGNTACPDFSNSSLSSRMNEEVTVLVKDKETGEPIMGAAVDIYTNPYAISTFRTNRKGIVKKELTKGMNFFDARYTGYLPASKKEAVGVHNNYIVLELVRDHNIRASLNRNKSVIVKDAQTRKPIKGATVYSSHDLASFKDDFWGWTNDQGRVVLECEKRFVGTGPNQRQMWVNKSNKVIDKDNDDEIWVTARAEGYNFDHSHHVDLIDSKEFVEIFLEPLSEEDQPKPEVKPDPKPDPIPEPESQPLTLIVYNNETKKIIPGVAMSLNYERQTGVQKTTDEKGTLGFDGKNSPSIYVSCSHDGFKPLNRFSVPLRRNQRIYKVYLKPIKKRTSTEVKIDSTETETRAIPPPVAENNTTEKPKEELVSGKLSTDLFSPNNIVFLVDISSSMKQRQRLELLKVATFQLLDLLRDVDRMAIVTYATETRVALESTSASETDKIEEVVMELEAKGFTAGGKGIKKAYDVAQENYIQGGNNEVIIITDGAFNIGQDDPSLIPTIKKNSRKGIKISVVGIKNGAATYESLQTIAKKGGGSYVKITTPEEAQTVLVDQIKEHSKVLN
ncbi:MAG: VWA domain-containing protein [Flavobacteriales bacterium]|nr:VWA domain-containing protein [Flavobacteriales bacterium]